ncbi:MAG: response regulator transcription factor [Clostridiales bacterium]|nr:response regulator transcription factor [Clostridiales bacterium]
MKNIAIVEDEDSAAEKLVESIKRYQSEFDCEFNIVRFVDAADFLADYKSVYAVVFMDIQMPRSNGMDAAFELRNIDKSVSLVFITNLMQYAQKGYEVDAVGYILKPFSYYDFSLKFRKALDRYVMAEERNVVLEIAGGMVRISCDKLMYVEILKHRLYYHLVDDVIQTTGVLSVVEKQLERHGFLRCNSCYLVNPQFVVSVKGQTVTVGNDELTISRPRRAAFMTKLTQWFAGRSEGSRS